MTQNNNESGFLTQEERVIIDEIMKLICDAGLKIPGSKKEWTCNGYYVNVDRGNLRLLAQCSTGFWLFYVICENCDEPIYIKDNDSGIWWQKLREEIPLLITDVRVAWLEKNAMEVEYIKYKEWERENELSKAARVLNGEDVEPPKKTSWWKKLFVWE